MAQMEKLSMLFILAFFIGFAVGYKASGNNEYISYQA